MTIGHNGGPTMPEGWVAISRDIIEHHIVGAGQPVDASDRNKGAFSRLESWLDLLMLANWAERKIDNHGVAMILQPGQTLAGRAYLAKRWNWSEKTVRVWLIRLERELMITLFCQNVHEHERDKSSKQGQTQGHTRNILTICNWDKYQNPELAQGPDVGRPEGHPRATQGPQKNKGTIKQDSEVKKEEEVPLALPAAIAAPLVPVVNGSNALEAFAKYNTLAQRIGLPLARTLTPQRRKNLEARLREHGGAEAWTIALANIERSAFLRGQNSRGWRVDFDFLLQARSFAKVVDGTYGNGAHGDTLKPESNFERMMRIGAEESERMNARKELL